MLGVITAIAMLIEINASYLVDLDGQSAEITVLSIPAEETSNRTSLVQACTCPDLLRMLCISRSTGIVDLLVVA